MTTVVSGIPMALIPHPQGPWLEGINPITNLQWRQGVEPLLHDGARYCLLEFHYRGDFMARKYSGLNDLMDFAGRNIVPENWGGRNVVVKKIAGRGMIALFQWLPNMSRPGFDSDNQPVVDVSWYHAKGWTLSQGGLYLLTDDQWEWSAQGGERRLKYATETGKLTGPKGKPLAHCSVKLDENATIDVYDSRYPDGPFGLRHKTGNVWEWTENNPYQENPYALRGGSWGCANREYLWVASCKDTFYPEECGDDIGFRVGAPAPHEDSPQPHLQGSDAPVSPSVTSGTDLDQEKRILAQALLRTLQAEPYTSKEIQIIAELIRKFSQKVQIQHKAFPSRLLRAAKHIFRDLTHRGFSPEDIQAASLILEQRAGTPGDEEASR